MPLDLKQPVTFRSTGANNALGSRDAARLARAASGSGLLGRRRLGPPGEAQQRAFQRR